MTAKKITRAPVRESEHVANWFVTAKMKKGKISSFLLDTFWIGWHRRAAWVICISVIFLLGALRIETDADFAFASLVIVPVLVIAWIGGKTGGFFVAFLAAAMWVVADIASERQFSNQWIPWVNAITRLMTYSLVVFLATQVRQQFKREHIHATRDALTGLLNRRVFLEAGDSEVERAKRDAHSLTVIFLDLDKFKQLNDTKGHDAGDAALRATAKALLCALPSADQVARLGGDEFAVLFSEIGYDSAVETGQKIYSAVNTALEDFPPVKGSIGVAWFEVADRQFPAMLKAADELMYEVKENGKDGIQSKSFAAATNKS